MKSVSIKLPEDSTPKRIGTSNSLSVRICMSSDLAEFFEQWPMGIHTSEGRSYVFQSKENLTVWSKTMGVARNTECCFVAVLDLNDKPLLLLPLGIEHRLNLRILCFLDGGVADYNAPVVFPPADQWDEATVRVIWKGIHSLLPSYDLAILEKIPREICGLSNPIGNLAKRPWLESGHYATLRGTWDEFAAQRIPFVSDSRRNRRKLAERGVVKFSVATTIEDQERFFSAMMRQKRRRYLETRGIDGFTRPGFSSYYAEMTNRYASQGFVHLSALTVNDVIVATHWGLVAGARFYYLLPTYEAGEWSRFSPGRLLLENLLEWSFLNGIRIFDFGMGDEQYKTLYCDKKLQLYEIIIPVTLRGRIFSLVRYLWRRLRKSSVWRLLKGDEIDRSLRKRLHDRRFISSENE